MRRNLLLNVNFRRMLSVRLFAFFALQAQAVIVGWQVYQLHHSAFLLGAIGLTEAIPAIALAFVSGHVVDSVAPYKVLRTAVTGLFVNSCLMAFVVHSTELSVSVQTFMLFFTVAVSGAARAFMSPSVFFLLPHVVEKHELSSAAAFNSSTQQFASVVGPALGGLLYGAFGARIAFVFLPLMIFISLIQVLRFAKPIQVLKNASKREPFLLSLMAGIQYVKNHRVLLSTMSLDMFSVLFGGAVAVLPIFADQVFHTDARGLGLLRAAPAIGSVLMAGYLGLRPLKKMTGRMLLIVIFGYGLSSIFFALSTNFWFALVILALGGMFDGINMVIRGTFIQLLTPDHMRGRVSALNSIFITSSNEIGAFESGVAASFLGLIPSVIFGGAMTLLIVLVAAKITPELAKTHVDETGHLAIGS